MSETRLYAAVKAFLEAQGFSAKGEIHGCDVVAIRPGEPPILVICELKMGFNLELVLQAADRMAMADAVWLAVPRTRRGRDRDRRVVKLCRLIGLGLLTVGENGIVEVLAEPEPYRPRDNKKRRARLIREHTRRRGDPTPGGSVRRQIMTAYRQNALACADALRDGEASTRVLRAVIPDAPGILLRNVYGWFERVSRGVYRLTPSGQLAATGSDTVPPVLLALADVADQAAGKIHRGKGP
ncbi:DUF2161 family putative PD-(D/E)XK-type phosphodiesterase [Acidisphaera sp. L21]|uniref:DUF2161 family putative PD-(D/E)XK-type phosphodiesterase n=1 Tax=Acidisphaera sp. L21 TaxID=1641851 RepID=UPI00131AED16|nr:DUF2161 family putative PD-(D/E)XK-type phosphodiesterase [Acidisphaera sp. L21]